MTTENTDAATRILTKTIRKLTKRLQIADQVLARQEAVSGSVARSTTRLTGDNRQDLAATHRRIMEPGVYLEELAEKRMAELADERKTTAELRPLVASQANDLVLTRDRIVEMETRIDKALDMLPSSLADEVDFGRIAAARAILRGES